MQISILLVSLGIYSIFLYQYADFYHLTWLIENAIDIFVLVFQKSVPVSPPWLFQEESDVAMAAWVYVGVLSQNGERGGCPSIQTGLCDCCQEGIHQWWRGTINRIYLFTVQSQTLDINFKNDLTELSSLCCSAFRAVACKAETAWGFEPWLKLEFLPPVTFDLCLPSFIKLQS